MPGRHKDPLQEHLSGSCPFLPPGGEQSEQASLGQGWRTSRVLLSNREGGLHGGGRARGTGSDLAGGMIRWITDTCWHSQTNDSLFFFWSGFIQHHATFLSLNISFNHISCYEKGKKNQQFIDRSFPNLNHSLWIPICVQNPQWVYFIMDFRDSSLLKISLDVGLESVSGRASRRHPLFFWPQKN